MNNTRLTYIAICLIVIFLAGSCGSVVHIDKHESFSIAAEKVKRVISIDPTFHYLELKTKGKKPLTSSKKAKFINDLLVNSAEQNGIYLNIVEVTDLEEGDMYFFEYLAPLKNEIWQSNHLQDIRQLNKDGDIKNKGNLVTIYKTGPQLMKDYSHLAEVFGTRYFALQGVLLQSKTNEEDIQPLVASASLDAFLDDEQNYSSIYYTIIADVVVSQVVYREYRKISTELTDANLSSIMFDSFKLITN